jgi:YD repeat-containing protein
VVVVLLLAAPPDAVAEIAYVYDELDRLVRVVREDGEAATYQYDAVGNLLSITRTSGVPQGSDPWTGVGCRHSRSGRAASALPIKLRRAGYSVVLAGMRRDTSTRWIRKLGLTFM